VMKLEAASAIEASRDAPKPRSGSGRRMHPAI
jgi:hypothetical protein